MPEVLKCSGVGACVSRMDCVLQAVLSRSEAQVPVRESLAYQAAWQAGLVDLFDRACCAVYDRSGQHVENAQMSGYH